MTRRRDDALTAAPFPASSLSRRAFLAGSAGGAALALAGCATGAKELFSGGSSGTTITVAIVSNSQMQDAISLSHLFESEHPDIHRRSSRCRRTRRAPRSRRMCPPRAASSTS
jgi:hypothetical protein